MDIYLINMTSCIYVHMHKIYNLKKCYNNQYVSAWEGMTDADALSDNGITLCRQ